MRDFFRRGPGLKTRLRRASVGAAIATVLALAAQGCGSSSGGESDAIRGTITMFGWNTADLKSGVGLGYAEAAKAFEAAHPNTEIKFASAPFANFVAAATTRARARNLGDVVEMLPDANMQPLFPAVKPLTQAEFGSLANSLTGWPATVESTSDTSRHVGVPLGAQGTLWYFNKSLFSKAGLDPNQPPRTWAQFMGAATKLKSAGITPIGMSGADSFLAWWAWSAFSPQGFPTTQNVFDVRAGKTPLNAAPFLTTLQPLRQTYANGWWQKGFQNAKFEDVQSRFIHGKVAMVPGPISSLFNWKTWDTEMGSNAYGVFRAPTITNGATAGQFYSPTLMIGITKTTKNPATAKAWIEFLASKKGQAFLLTAAGQFPNRSDINVLSVTQSPGAAAILKVVKENGAHDVAQNQFSASAQGAALQNLTGALTSGHLEPFLDNLEHQQQQR